MSLEPNLNRPKLRLRFMPVMHIVMGLFFIIIGVVAAFKRNFGAVALSAGWAYAFGGLLLLYGTFRIWRGITDLRENPEDER